MRLTPLITLNKPSQFKLVRDKGVSWHTPCFIVSALKHDDMDQSQRIGLILTKKIGNAVKRNRIKRRLRPLLRDILPTQAIPADYVVIGKAACLDASGENLRKDMLWALKKLSLSAPVSDSSKG